MQRPSTIRSRAALFSDALVVMEAEYASDLALNGLARRLASSRRQLQRCFDERGEGSFRFRLAAIRMRRAADLLAGTSLPVREVAAAVGYRQPAQFAKAFTRHHGCVPTAFRAGYRPAAGAIQRGPSASPQPA